MLSPLWTGDRDCELGMLSPLTMAFQRDGSQVPGKGIPVLWNRQEALKKVYNNSMCREGIHNYKFSKEMLYITGGHGLESGGSLSEV